MNSFAPTWRPPRRARISALRARPWSI